MWGLLGDLLRTPDAQNDPQAWGATLLAHAMICLGLAMFLPWWIVIAGYGAWEAVQWRRYGADPWDCLLDWTGACLGVCVAVAFYPQASVIALAVVLAVGVRNRR